MKIKGYKLMDDVLVIEKDLTDELLDNLSKESLLQVEKLVCNKGVNMIEAEALYFCCNIREIYLSETVVDIHQSAFTHCDKLEKIVLSGKTLNAVIRAAIDEDFFTKEDYRNALLDERMESVFDDDEDELVDELTEQEKINLMTTYFYIRFDVKVVVY